MRYMGIDFGTKRIGIALSNESNEFALPHSVVKNDARLMPTLEGLCAEYNVSTIVVGESKDFSGKDNPVMEHIREFIGQMSLEIPGVRIELEPEFLTSHQAHHIQGKTPLLDASSAAIILQSFLDKQKHSQ